MDNRLINLREIVRQRGGVSQLSRDMGYSNPSFLSQMLGPNPTRLVTEKTARKFEKLLGIPLGALDREPGEAAQAPVDASEQHSTSEMVAHVIRVVGRACDEESAQPNTEKFANAVALAYLDAAEHGGQIREDHVKQLVRLLK